MLINSIDCKTLLVTSHDSCKQRCCIAGGQIFIFIYIFSVMCCDFRIILVWYANRPIMVTFNVTYTDALMHNVFCILLNISEVLELPATEILGVFTYIHNVVYREVVQA